MSRRVKRRIAFDVGRRSRRPIEKIQVVVNQVMTGNAQIDTTLFTTTDPVTAGGFHWDTRWKRATDATLTNGKGGVWAIVISRQDIAVNTMSTTNSGTPYSPVEHVIAAGVYMTTNVAVDVIDFTKGDSKTMRKLKCGDTVHFLCKGQDGDGTVEVDSIVTFFNKH